MARPRAKELTERELEIMQVFWKHGEMTAVEARDRLAAAGLDRAYTTIATLVRILVEKEFSHAASRRRTAISIPADANAGRSFRPHARRCRRARVPRFP